jgi:hypothetical protein
MLDAERFPEDFIFRLSRKETIGQRHFAPYAFMERGMAMSSSEASAQRR